MSDLPNDSPTPSAASIAAVAPAPRSAGARLIAVLWTWFVGAVLVIVCVTALAVTWKTQQRVRDLEQELVRRQQDSQGTAVEARTIARQALDNAREAAAKSALLEARVSEVAMQRGQLEDLIQSLSRSRDENVLVDIEAAIRVALQQSAITGSAEPLVSTLRQADERLQRYDQPRLEGVRRAIARDLDKIKAVSVVDIASLNIRLDEAVRLVDDMPLLANAMAASSQANEPSAPVPTTPSARRRAAAASASANAAAGANVAASAVAVAVAASAGVRGAAASAASAPDASAEPDSVMSRWSMEDWWPSVQQHARDWGGAVWSEVRSLVRVTHIESPEAMLLGPEQSFFLRENLKLRLLNARLALLSRQFDTTQSDLLLARSTIDRYFDRSSRKVLAVNDLIKQVAAQAHQVSLPRPDDTLAAIAASAAGH